MTRTSNPTVSRRWIALELRRLRHQAGMSQADVAKALRCQVPKISLIESTQRNVQDGDLEKLLDLFEVPHDRRGTYRDAAKNGRKKAWWERYEGHIIPDWAEQYVGLEQGAERLRSYQNAVVHGLLQTDGYTEALLRSSPAISEERLEQVADVRAQRQSALQRNPNPLEVWAVMDEAIVHRVVGDPDTMRSQLLYLAEVGRDLPNVHVLVIPFERGGALEAVLGPFTVLSFPWRSDPGVVYVEYRSGAFYLESLREVDAHSQIFDRLESLALPQDESVEMLRTAANSHK
jgi:transcriptional regulator with XRE-family HTH domain